METVKKIPVILDTDPGIDDAVAIAAALFHERIDVRLITTVAGNVGLDKTTNNALKLLEFFGKEVPVARGAAKPLVRPAEDSSHIHGESGMDGYDFDEPKQTPLDHAVLQMRDTIMNSPEPITIVPIGPLTNVALLLTLFPECKEKIERIVLMGGSASRGNHTPNAEYNIYADPEAASIVFNAGLPLVMVGLDVTSQATLTTEIVEKIKEMNKTGFMLYSLFQHYRGGSLKSRGLKMHDLCAIAYLVNPGLFKTQDCFVDIELAGTYTAGTTVTDITNRLGKPSNATVCLDIDVPAFREWAIEVLGKTV
ncbi:MAG: ribonucleoside hydrolase RihC [Paenibacillus dendritiformis]|uniref:ribonucleoside hydrolase RihC n=1 Tax=Paenibacillus dendritiformis TaxID=130049 RepID=UPI001B100F45|nr:ribonucleoside hydrolase RihC [Paenibacillus dendritiformis]MDU5142606.1 ribonucleoside hydrolase RihC [Paenibacillus dendritiformis]GIO74945.1 non-specific ribonucleoside hydrolase RihC [Paenibacillus dendritiformis]